MKKNWIIGMVILIVILGAVYFLSNGEEAMDDVADEDVASYMDVSAEEAKALIDNNADLIILDVSPFYDKGHLPGAINYYFGDGTLDAAIPSLDKDANYLVYCHVDSASITGATKLTDAGFTSVYRLESHYAGWVAAGYDTEK